MEKEKRFHLFIPQRRNAGQVSAGRGQVSAGPRGLVQGSNKCSDDDFKLPSNMSNRGEITDSDTISQQVKLCSEVDEESTETMNELFSKLYKEAEKIKQWELTVESELNQKERKLQENRKIIEAQNKAIQELQFENEKLRLKLEDEMCENKDLLKEATALRHLCNLLKETYSHFTEKTSKYEQEKNETRQLYEELHSDIERMTVAFEELHMQAEKDRLEMSIKLKEEAEKVDKFEKECKLEVSQKEKQISALTIQRDEKDGVIEDIKAQLKASENKIADLIEAKLREEEMLKESQASQEHLRAELEEAKISLQKAEVTQKNLETECQTTGKTLIQVTGEKEAQEEECKKMEALLAALTEEFETSTANLKSLLQKEQKRLKEYEDKSKLLTLELQNKSAELEEMTKVKCDKEVQLEELSETLVNVGGLLLKKDLEATVENLQREKNVERESKLFLFLLQKEIHDLKVQLTSTAEKEQDYLNQVLTLKTDLEQEELKNEQLTVYLNKLSLEKEQIAQEKNGVAAELKRLQEKQEDSKKKEENTKQLVENLEEANGQLRSELESLKEKMAKTGEEIKSKLDEREENVKGIENGISIKEKQLQILENKMNSLKKQVENKAKHIEELQQENKVLKKKITAESKKNNIYEGKVNKLQLEMENMNKQHKEAVDIYQKDIEARKMNENKLHEEVEKLRLLYDEATMIQRETDIRCQRKITEMVALMEKHKNEYDKVIEEKDEELKVYKIKQQKQLSSERALENELSCLKSELSSLKEQLKAEIEEKENLVKEHSQKMISESEKKHKTYIVKTPPVDKLQSGRSTNLPSEESTRKKQKVLLQLDSQSDSSEYTDLLTIVSEEEMFEKLYKDYPQASQLHSTAPKKTPTSSNVKSPGSSLRFKTMRRTRQADWTAVSKMDRKRKIKEAAKFFTQNAEIPSAWALLMGATIGRIENSSVMIQPSAMIGKIECTEALRIVNTKAVAVFVVGSRDQVSVTRGAGRASFVNREAAGEQRLPSPACTLHGAFTGAASTATSGRGGPLAVDGVLQHPHTLCVPFSCAASDSTDAPAAACRRDGESGSPASIHGARACASVAETPIAAALIKGVPSSLRTASAQTPDGSGTAHHGRGRRGSFPLCPAQCRGANESTTRAVTRAGYCNPVARATTARNNNS
ncbi:synaptonemal complex protein 1-like [Poecile atricapillus]|uniref:synaptonemal complex protein 1-like n=1 Tax=Poecile atricapillus TaxID=48891 RepID=UPI0027388457|nr:synaptonemal complex protein 1-like [Poecile atricapillus]